MQKLFENWRKHINENEEQLSYDQQGNYTGPQLDEKEVLQLVQNFYKAMSIARDNIKGKSRDGTVKDWAIQAAKDRAARRNPELELKVWFQDTVGRDMYEASRAMAPVYQAVRQGWRGSANSVDIITHHAGDMAEKFLSVKSRRKSTIFKSMERTNQRIL